MKYLPLLLLLSCTPPKEQQPKPYTGELYLAIEDGYFIKTKLTTDNCSFWAKARTYISGGKNYCIKLR